jgi:hypothetical protein
LNIFIVPKQDFFQACLFWIDQNFL